MGVGESKDEIVLPLNVFREKIAFENISALNYPLSYWT